MHPRLLTANVKQTVPPIRLAARAPADGQAPAAEQAQGMGR